MANCVQILLIGISIELLVSALTGVTLASVTPGWGNSVMEAPPRRALLKPTEAWREHIIKKREPRYEYIPIYEPPLPPPKEEPPKPVNIVEEVPIPIIQLQPIIQLPPLPPPSPPPPSPPPPPPPPPLKEKSFKASTEFKLNGGLYTDIKGTSPLLHVFETIKPQFEEIKKKFPVLFQPAEKEKIVEPPPPPPKEPTGKKVEFIKTLAAGKSWAIYFGNVFGQALTQFLAGTQSVLKKVAKGPEPEFHFPEK